jgi:hypothetical protein
MTEPHSDGIFLPSVVLVTTEQESAYPIRAKDWNRIRTKVGQMKKRRREFAAFAWAMIGITSAATFACIVWLPAYNLLPAAQQLRFAWIAPMFIVVAAATAVMATLGFIASRLFGQAESTSAADIVADMDSIVPPSANPV